MLNKSKIIKIKEEHEEKPVEYTDFKGDIKNDAAFSNIDKLINITINYEPYRPFHFRQLWSEQIFQVHIEWPCIHLVHDFIKSSLLP